MATISKYTTKAGTTLYRVRYRTPQGRQTDKRGFTTKRDANAFAASVEVDKLTGSYIAPKLGKETVATLGAAWLQRQEHLIKPSTFRSYEGIWRVHVLPRWGTTAISAIMFTDVQAWISELAGRRSASLVCDIHMVFGRILDDAVDDKKLAANPARNSKLKLPERPPQRNTYLTAQQLDQLATESGRYRPLVLLLGLVGLRWGEAIALRRCDCNFLRRKVELHRNAVWVGNQHRFVVGTLKNNKNRTVDLPAPVVDALAQVVEGKGNEDLLWPAPGGGQFLKTPGNHDSWMCIAVRRCQQAANEARAEESKGGREPTTPIFPRVTPHDLRHTAASLAISSGANPKVVQRMLGHQSAAITLDVYADLFESDMTKVAENMGTLWAREVGAG